MKPIKPENPHPDRLFTESLVPWTLALTFRIYGVPAPGGSKKAFWRPGMKFANIVDDAGERNKNWRALVAHEAAIALPIPYECDLRVECVFTMPRCKAHYRRNGTLRPNAPRCHNKKPDLTKLFRSTEDACTGLIWRDDAQVVEQALSKVYGDRPGATIRVYKAGSVG